MANLDQVLGAVIMSLVNARRMADEQSAAVAQHYRSNPLLQGLSIPRVRVPELRIDLPLLVEAVTEAEPPLPADAETVAKEAGAALTKAADLDGRRLDAALTADWVDALTTELRAALAAAQREVSTATALRESIALRVERSLLSQLRESAGTRAGLLVDPALSPRWIAAVKNRVRELVVASPGQPTALAVSVLTADIKDRGSPESVSRLQLIMREEGLEWQEVRRADGSSSASLGPE